MTKEANVLYDLACADLPAIFIRVRAEVNRLFCESIEKEGKLSGCTREIPLDDGPEIFRIRQEQAIRELAHYCAPALVPIPELDLGLDKPGRTVSWTVKFARVQKPLAESGVYVWRIEYD